MGGWRLVWDNLDANSLVPPGTRVHPGTPWFHPGLEFTRGLEIRVISLDLCILDVLRRNWEGPWQPPDPLNAVSKPYLGGPNGFLIPENAATEVGGAAPHLH